MSCISASWRRGSPGHRRPPSRRRGSPRGPRRDPPPKPTTGTTRRRRFSTLAGAVCQFPVPSPWLSPVSSVAAPSPPSRACPSGSTFSRCRERAEIREDVFHAGRRRSLPHAATKVHVEPVQAAVEGAKRCAPRAGVLRTGLDGGKHGLGRALGKARCAAGGGAASNRPSAAAGRPGGAGGCFRLFDACTGGGGSAAPVSTPKARLATSARPG